MCESQPEYTKLTVWSIGVALMLLACAIDVVFDQPGYKVVVFLNSLRFCPLVKAGKAYINSFYNSGA